jgi:cell pole-organizing protein PopZ
MKGTNEELGKQILAQSGLPIIAADTMAEAAEKVVAASNAQAAPSHTIVSQIFPADEQENGQKKK